MSYRGAGLVLIVTGTAYFGWWLEEYRRGDAFIAAETYLRATPALVEVTGSGIQIGRFPVGGVGVGPRLERASFRVGVRGAEGRARVDLELRRTGGGWQVSAARTRDVALLEPAPQELLSDASREALAANARGYALYQNARPEEAAVEFQRSIELDPSDASAHRWHGHVLEELGDQAAALESFLRARELDPDDVHNHYAVGVAYGRLGRLMESLASLERAVELDPEHRTARYSRGVTRNRLGDLAGAIEDLKAACEMGYEPGCAAVQRFR